MTDAPRDAILVRGARQNNLKNLDLDIPLNELVVVTGVSGSGKSSLVFDTLYAEGQRRYVETFSPYARQFLDRMDKPQVDSIAGIPPAIAIDQTNPVRTSRSTVGTMTELNDHLKLLYARTATLYCECCGRPVRRDTSETIYADLRERAQSWGTTQGGAGDPRLLLTFPVPVPDSFKESEVRALLEKQGYTRFFERTEKSPAADPVRPAKGSARGKRARPRSAARPAIVFEVVQDRFRAGQAERGRVLESIENALRVGRGRVNVQVVDDSDPPRPLATWRYSSALHCAECDRSYREPTPSLFSFNSPLGACETCRGFGRTIGIDYGLVIPDETKSLRGGALKPWQTKSYAECQQDMEKFAKKRGIPLDVPWRELQAEHRRWVIEGEGDWSKGVWYGAKRFFAWLEGRSYKMHVRVLLSRYRAYTPCEACGGARLKAQGLLWRVGDGALADTALGTATRFRPRAVAWSEETLRSLPGLSIHDLMLMPVERACEFFRALQLPRPLDEATDLLLGEIRGRFAYLTDVGLGYLTLDRQSRTLSGGEVQRINLTTALGTSLVNTLFVLDEPSIGLHPRDMQRVITVMKRLRDAGNSLLVVEHDPQIMLEADRILDMGPGAGERGGQIVFCGTPRAIRRDGRSLTGEYLSGRRRVAPERPGRMPGPGAPPPGRASGTPSSVAPERPGRMPGPGAPPPGRASGTPSSEGTAAPPVEVIAEARSNRWLELRGARQHNLKDVDVRIPLKRLVCVTGVSGSGKSTLIEDVLYPALLKYHGKPTEAPGLFSGLAGAELIDDVVMVDQSPIGRTTRSNPASYVGAFDAIRNLFAVEPAAQERKYTAGTFSFNSGNGRCPTCSGNGFEHVEMQFLSDVYLRCPDCNGRRYRDEVLEIKREGPNGRRASIAEVLDMTVTEALEFFRDSREVAARLAPLSDVGLEYVTLGQPVPTLSGGEAQRLKLAGHLAAAGSVLSSTTHKGKLFLFDEPTTGLHFQDVAKLLTAFRKLLAAGHSLLVIEHNLDVIRASDWIIDLGPEGGERGGRIVCVGTADEVRTHPGSHTGRALADYARAVLNGAEVASGASAGQPLSHAVREPGNGRSGNAIVIHNAREHNLKSIDVQIPRDRLTVITGVSGSGKSTLAFDILFNEGQRRYLESLNAYARQFVQPAARPDVDAIFGIPPTVAIEQRTSRGGRKSTVATLTEIYHFLRLLYVKLGTQHCPDCHVAIESQSAASIAARLLREYKGKRIALLAPLVVARKGYYTDLAKWAAKKGFKTLRVDGATISTAQWPRLSRFKEHTIELPVAQIDVGAKTDTALHQALARALDFGKGLVHVLGPKSDRPTIFSTKRACPSCGRSFAELDPRLFSYNSKHGWCESCFGTGLEVTAEEGESAGSVVQEDGWEDEAPEACPSCAGKRLNPIALSVRFRERSIADLAADSVAQAAEFFRQLKLAPREQQIARDLLAEIRARLKFLDRVGLGYLELDRSAPTLSGGEAQRIRLAAQLGSNLQGVCYVLDEPTIGLHPRDNAVLLDSLAELSSHRNTLVVVEHDEETIRRADHVLDLGPGAGVLGGEVVGEGTVKDLIGNARSTTGRFLRQPLRHPARPHRPVDARTPSLRLEQVSLHNVKGANVRIPLGRLVVITGVSGSGKSTVARDVLYANLRRQLGDAGVQPSGRRRTNGAQLIGCAGLRGLEQVNRVLEVDQTPIGKTPRSCPATYIGLWDDIRRTFAATTEARLRGYSASRFSFNTAGGRCEACEGQGVKTIEMSFLPDVKVLCDVCGGRRFNSETLSVLWREKSIGDVLAMDVDEAVEFFRAHSRVHHALKLLQDVGLGYLTLGQQSPTLSGGEAQRIKLVAELAKVRTEGGDEERSTGPRQSLKHTLYVLDEPTVGLHMADVEKLIHVLHRLVAAGNTAVVVEHNLDVMAEADWVLDMGPEAGAGGGRVVAQGAPAEVARRKRDSHTGRALEAFLKDRVSGA
ncbi:MAG: ATP-binding cassette domain-containing protein [Gammaproteobacteria bacterium]|nr:ATP-binding cassette domain-containing protein [Gammaproteobacteria bacterium]